MGNMGYCRFQNTLSDLEDCYKHLDDSTKDMETWEKNARDKIVELCKKIAEEYGD
jgi:hypothetical protein